MITTRKAVSDDLPAIRRLLQLAGLPVDDLDDPAITLFAAERNGRIVGAGGYQYCGATLALLRSFVVDPTLRGRGLGRALHDAAVAQCHQSAITSLYLLTHSASDYFARLGFSVVERATAPPAIAQSRQFSQLCPATAVLMHRSLSDHGSCCEDGAGVVDDAPLRHAEELFDAGYFCAEAVLLATTSHLRITSPLIPAIASGFCSGISRSGGMCGAVTGGVLALNLLYGRDRPVETLEQNYAAVQQFIQAFEQSHGSSNCQELLGCHLGTPQGQQQFREQQLHLRCRNYTATAVSLALATAKRAGGTK
ncbi:MAG TPA: arsenic resistance N-acetyltransferase ArsN2 [Gammaproteobacteria bacterium]